MTPRLSPLALLIAILAAVPTALTQSSSTPADFTQSLAKLSLHGPDPCDAPESDWHPDESPLNQAADLVVKALNSTGTSHASPQIATDALKKLEQTSTSINAKWPEENRFHFKVIDMPPAILVTISLGSQERFFVFGIPPAQPDQSARLWRVIGEGGQPSEDPAPRTWLDVRTLQRGPSNNPRFLVQVNYSGCAGSFELTYYLEEWNPDNGYLTQVMKQDGAMGMDETADGQPLSKEHPFHPIGKLRTEGPTISLPYCWFSPIDWWDNPSMCALDSYDLSQDQIHFRSRTYNRPELAPIAKAVEYVNNNDLQAARGYCASMAVARKLFAVESSGSDASDPKVRRLGPGKARVELGGGSIFYVEQRASGWVITDFK